MSGYEAVVRSSGARMPLEIVLPSARTEVEARAAIKRYMRVTGRGKYAGCDWRVVSLTRAGWRRGSE